MTDSEAIARIGRTLESHGERIRSLEIMEAEAKASRRQMDENLKSIQSDIRWLIRLVIGALILAIVAFVVDGGMATAGVF
jgi:hypothetical protein